MKAIPSKLSVWMDNQNGSFVFTLKKKVKQRNTLEKIFVCRAEDR
jgi:hypothetical protein